MVKYSQKELLREGFYNLIKKTAGVMKAIDPKVSANLQKPFTQGRDIYRAATQSAGYDAKTSQYVPGSKNLIKQPTQKNIKLIKKIAATEKELYNREVDLQNINTINMKQQNGKAVQMIVVSSKDMRSAHRPPERYLYDMRGNFIKKI